MNSYTQAYELKKDKKEEITVATYSSLYMISHLIISFFAIYLSWKCNNGFNLISFLISFTCPYLYIIWALATRGGCGIFDANCLVEPIRRITA
jgi:hypothetical protein